MDLISIVAISLLLIPLVAFTEGLLRIILGIALVLFFPGYAFLAALFPRKASLTIPERMALSVGLSIALVPLIAIVLNWTPLGITVYSSLVSLLLFTSIMSTLGLYRRRGLPYDDRFQPLISFGPSSIFGWWREGDRWRKALKVTLVLTLLAPIATLTYLIANPKVGTELTEFYILGPQGKADDYPREFMLRDGKVTTVIYSLASGISRVEAEGKLTVGVVNQERQEIEYKVAITIEGEEVLEEISPFTLQPGEKWEQEVTISPTKIGLNQKVEFFLYNGVDTQPYRKLHLLIDVGSLS